MVRTLEKEIVTTVHDLNNAQLLEVKRFIDAMTTTKRNRDLLSEEEIDMIRSLTSDHQRK
ncbi:hypothetical protein [Vibrio methylphosphonaticus]|uniref:hypothetical protein n=1 Tax=Vibrio methylphosphonaticus TaxID=2946866 RepID=UPI00202A96C9|nr:hypothetical protein [Vibrio methylphosphonaticus]MCL9774168.1 hypothetical protein [Vibrio methylphosphonaticus]